LVWKLYRPLPYSPQKYIITPVSYVKIAPLLSDLTMVPYLDQPPAHVLSHFSQRKVFCIQFCSSVFPCPSF
jgi:hypothetical protein